MNNFRVWAKVVVLFLVFGVAGWLVLSGNFFDQKSSDQETLRKLFAIPDDYEVVEYTGFPAISGTMQREGLSLSASYKLSAAQAKDFEARIAREKWDTLPIYDKDILEHLNAYKFNQNLRKNIAEMKGFYNCRTSGDNVLHAVNAIPCTEANKGYLYTNCPEVGKTAGCIVKRHYPDIILATYSPENQRLTVVVHANY